jgi:hypothetical protein
MSTEFINDQWRLPNNENKDKQSNYSMDFDGANGTGIAVNGSLTTLGISDTFSFSLWVNVSNYIQYKNILSNSNFYSGFGLYMQNNRWRFQVNNYNTNYIEDTTNIIENQWYHIAVTWNNTTGAKMYVNNGTPITGLAGLTLGNLSTNIEIGGTSNSSQYTPTGQIDGVSIFNYALSSSQITTLYGSSSTGIGNPMSLSPKPVAMYNLGDKSAFNGANYLVPNASLKDFVFNNKVQISSNGVNLGNTFTISWWFKNNPSSAGTASSDGSTGNMIIKGQAGSTGTMIRFNRNRSIQTYFNSTTISFEEMPSNMYYGDGDWHMVTFVRAANTAKIYIDNNLAMTKTNFGTDSTYFNGTGDSEQNDNKFSNVLVWNTSLSDGGVSDGSQVSSSSEMQTLYNYGSPIKTLSSIPQNSSLKVWWKLDASATYDGTDWTIPDDSSNSNDGTSSGMTQANLVQSDLSFTSGYSPYALDFDGANDYIDCGASSFSGETEISVSAWVYPKATGTGAAEAVLSTEKTSSTSRGFYLSLFIGNEFRWQVSTDGSSKDSLDSGTILLNQWSHVAATWNQSTMSLYVNGSLVDTMNTVNATGTFTTTNNIFIAKRDSSAGFFPGSISNPSIWNTALTSAQVTEIYSEGVPSNLNNHSAYSNLVSWWQLGSNTSWVDPYWIALDEKGTNNGQSQNVAAPNNMGENAIVDGVGSYANGLSSGMGGDEVIGDAPYSTANSLSVNMDVLDRVTDTPS